MVRDEPKLTARVVSNSYEGSAPLLENEIFVYLKDGKRHKGIGLAGILTKPKSLGYGSFAEQVRNQSKYSLPTHKLVLLLHGHQAHKNTIYQPLLAEKLSEQGYNVLRIDFRGLGDSEDNFDASKGRTIDQDVEDITTVYEFVSSEACYELLGYQMTLDTIIAHSRGVISMFEFAKRHSVRNLINCCGRFDSSGLLAKVQKRNPSWQEDGGFFCKALRFGEWVDIWVPKSETISAGTLDTSSFACIDPHTWITSVYCERDNVIPITAAAEYNNMFYSRSTLHIVPYADHNFYGLPDDTNPLLLPLRKGKVNYNHYLIDLLLKDHFTSKNEVNRFYKAQKLIVSIENPGCVRNRWPLPHDFSNVSNFRDIGGYKTLDGKQVKSGILYRCANPDLVTLKAISYMKNVLNIERVFDLRDEQEAKEAGIIAGIKVENIGFSTGVALSPEELAKHYEGLMLSSHNFHQAYSIILKNSFPQIRQFFQHILSGNVNSENAVVFHCAAGKDRTGILGMLILGIVNVDVDTICREYELSSVGITTERRLLQRINGRGDRFYDFLGAEGKKIAERYGVTPDLMASNVLSSTYEAMRIFIEEFLEDYDSFENFFLEKLDFTQQELKTIRSYLIH